jgi:radical SAM protein with 4Fe4S-binding SPASM domain
MYENIGYIFNELSHADIVFDECGAIFLSEIGREPKHIQAAAMSIASRFVDGNHEEVQNDLREFISQLERSGFVVTGQTISELDEKERIFSYSSVALTNVSFEPLDESHAPSSEVLKKHFWKYPRLFDVQIELTSFCNLTCIHCYLGEKHPTGGLAKDKVFSILDQLKAMGTLQVSFTGGEILSRPDLPEILRYARLNDFSISLLTNNTLLTDSLVEEFKNTGVRLVKISLYSMKPEIHDAITRHPGSWKKTVGNIQKLVAGNVPLQVSCPVMKQNLDSFAEVITWGRAMHFNVKPDLLLTARADFSRDNLNHRLSLDESQKAIRSIIAVDVEYQKRLSSEYGINNHRHPDDHICGVGTSTMCIGANGDFYPCPAFQMKLGNIYDDTVQDVWENSARMSELRNVKYSAFTKCSKCPSSDYCPICMGKFYSESGGDIYATSDFFCGVSHCNRQIAEEYLSHSRL